MRTSTTPTLIILLFSIVIIRQGSAQDHHYNAEPTTSPSDVLEKHIDAIGGRSAMSDITAIKIVSSIRMSTPYGNRSGSILHIESYPNKVHELIEMGAPLQEVWCDGTTVEEFSGCELKEFTTEETLRELERHQMHKILRHEELGYEISIAETKFWNDKPVYVLDFHSMHNHFALLINMENYLLEGRIAYDHTEAGETTTTTVLSDHESVDGIIYPFKHTTTIENVGKMTVIVESIEHNPEIDESEFTRE